MEAITRRLAGATLAPDDEGGVSVVGRARINEDHELESNEEFGPVDVRLDRPLGIGR